MPFKKQLAMYASYHKDRRNIATHMVGIPLIVLGLGVFLAKPQFTVFGTPLSPVWVVSILLAIYYLCRDWRIGLASSVWLIASAWTAQCLVKACCHWLEWAVGLFVAGWVAQFIGHYFEGRKPAFFDDLRGLIIGPAFVVAELLCWLRLYPLNQHSSTSHHDGLDNRFGNHPNDGP